MTHKRALKLYSCSTCNGKGKITNNPDRCWACNGFKYDQSVIVSECKEYGLDANLYSTPLKAINAIISAKRRENNENNK